jgi:hypothetical protein
MTRWWKQPLAGDIVWSWFPDEFQTKPAQMPRPALVVSVYDDEAPHYGVLVAYGTSQRVNTLFRGEFAITRSDGDAFNSSGLSFETKFDFSRCLQLPFSDEFFGVPPGAPHGQQPKLGALHAVLMRRAAGAHAGAKPRNRR